MFKNTANKHSNSASGQLGKLFHRQQPKVKASARKAAFLKQFAEEDYKRIALLIGKWLDQDDQKKSR